MSQCYHVELKQSVTRIVRAADTVSYPVELTEVLPPEEMKEVLRQVLTDDGWIRSGDHRLESGGSGGETLTVDLESMELTATLTAEKEVATEVKAAGQGESTRSARRIAQVQLEEKAAVAGESIEDSGKRQVQKEATDRLSQSEEGRRRTMNELLQRVYTEALKRKAGQLGDILEISESTSEGGDYELLIRVAQ